MNKKEKVDKGFITPGQTTGLTDRQIKAMALRMLRAVKRHATKPDVVAPEPTPSDGIDPNAENILIFYGPRSKTGWKYQLTENQKKPVDDPSWQQIARALSTIDGTAPHSYAILASQNGEFIQACACNGEYHIEIKNIDQIKKTESLCVAGVAPSQTKAGKSGTPKLPIAGIKGEVLNKAQALKLFKPFWKNKPMPTKFLWRDIQPELLKKIAKIRYTYRLSKHAFNMKDLIIKKASPVDDPSWQQIVLAISELEGATMSGYAQLDNGVNGFIEATASDGKYRVEIFEVNRTTNTALQWAPDLAPLQAKTIKSGEPKPRVTDTKGELLNKAETLALFKAYWKRKPTPKKFIWREYCPKI